MSDLRAEVTWRWCTASEFCRPMGITHHSYSLNGVFTALYLIESRSIHLEEGIHHINFTIKGVWCAVAQDILHKWKWVIVGDCVLIEFAVIIHPTRQSQGIGFRYYERRQYIIQIRRTNMSCSQVLLNQSFRTSLILFWAWIGMCNHWSYFVTEFDFHQDFVR